MPMTPKQLEKLILANGWIKVRQNGTSHAQYKKPGVPHLITIPFHSKDLKKGIEKKILKDAGLL